MTLRESSPRFIVDWQLLLPALALAALGILTMSTFGAGDSLAPRQLIWLLAGVLLYFAIASIDLRFIRRMPVVMTAYGIAFALLAALLVVAHPVMGAKAWFTFGSISFQPADFTKLALIALLAKYLSRRHIEIHNIRHILVSGAYTIAVTLLVLIEPDLGTALILGAIWLGMMLISGISKKHLAALGVLFLVVAAGFWFEGLKDYQRERILAFVNPASDIHGAGYNAYQARIAVGSGGIFGKGVGYGTQSKLRFLPEYQTDFIFAAYAEEWGFVGAIFILLLYGLIFWRLGEIARTASTNFDAFFTLGVLILLAAHVTIHAGINVGLLPVTGTTIPFMSSGGSHVVMEFVALGVVTSLARFGRSAPRASTTENEYLGG
jgi:rod shape determining protein RodA